MKTSLFLFTLLLLTLDSFKLLASQCETSSHVTYGFESTLSVSPDLDDIDKDASVLKTTLKSFSLYLNMTIESFIDVSSSHLYSSRSRGPPTFLAQQ